MDLQDKGRSEDTSDHRDVADKVEVELLIERSVDGVRRSDGEQRVAVCRRAHHRLGREIGGTAWSVLDDKLLAEPLGECLRNQASRNVGCAAGGKAYDDAHRSRRIILGPCNWRRDGKR